MRLVAATLFFIIVFFTDVIPQIEMCNSKWGDSPATVKKKEKFKLTSLSDGSLNGKYFFLLEEYKATYNFCFDKEQKFNEFWITVQLSKSDANDYFRVFEKLTSIIDAISFKREWCKLLWKNNSVEELYSDMPEFYGTALVFGMCSKVCNWTNAHSNLSMLLTDDNLAAKLIIKVSPINLK
ncbi:MAG: hypothetical protein J0L60_06785 [Ignavibacteria bacterium]|nr:hypothetical protein [Ignavibacteria bacterium]